MSAGEHREGPPSGGGTVTVLGHGVASVAPDEAEVVVGVDVVRPTAGEARDVAAGVMASVVAAVRATGIAPDAIRTADLALGPEIEYGPEGQPRRVGFRLGNRIVVRVSRTDDVARVVDAAVGSGATAVEGITFRVRDAAAARRAALTSAMADARAAAETVAATSGARIGRLLVAREVSEPDGPTPRLAMMEAMPGGTPVSPGLSHVEAALSVTWELVPG